MATISSPGIGSGLDVRSIITQLMAIERQPKDKLAADATKIQTQISEVGKISSAVAKLRDLSAKLSASSFWQQTSAASSNAAVSVTTSSNALAAAYAVQVQQLASAQSLVAGHTFAASTAAVGSGTLTLELGTWGTGQSSFAPRLPASAASSVDINVLATDTVETLRDKINASGAAVAASVLTDATGARLVLRSKEAGLSNGFRVQTSGATGALASLGYDPSSGVTAAIQTTAAANALVTIDGVAVSSTSNTLANVLDGVSLTLTAPTTGPVQVTVASDAEAIKKTLQDFATAYSEVTKLIATDTKYDAAARRAGPLQGDGSIVALQSRLRSLLGDSSTASATFTRLSDAGFEQQRDGSLTLNATRVANALANLPQLRALFANANPLDATAEGFGRRFRSAADNMLNTGGTLTTRSSGLTDKLQRNQKSQDALDQRLAQTQKRLEAQYGSLDTKLAALNGFSTYVTQQISQWNRSTG